MTNPNSNLLEDVSGLLHGSLRDVFATTFTLEIKPEALADLRADGEPLVAGSVGFVGDVSGMVYIFLPASFAELLTDRMLGPDEIGTRGMEMINDVVGELGNMVVGAVKSQLCDSGKSCVLTIPSVMRGQNLSAAPVSDVSRRVLGFSCAGKYILVELQLKFAN